MRQPHAILFSVIAAALVIAPVTKAFLDEIAQLREELQVAQTSKAANFSDLVSKLDEISGPSFTDVADESWYYKYVASVGNWGIVSGYFDASGKRTGLFGPQNPVTIAEALKMSFKAARVDQTACADDQLKHAEETSHWSKAFVSCAEEMRVRIFELNDCLNLDRPVTRAEALSVIHDVFKENVPRIYSEFNDTQGHIFEADVAYAVLQGIVTGDGGANGKSLGTFRPDDSINRAEMSKLIYQQLKAGTTLKAESQEG